MGDMALDLNPLIQSLVKGWVETFRNVMETMADCKPDMQIQASLPADALAGMLWWKQPMDAAPNATIWVGVAAEAWTALGKRLLTAAGIESADEGDVKNTYVEVLQQSLNGLAQSLSAQLGREILCVGGAEGLPAATSPTDTWVGLAFGAEILPPLCLQVSAALVEAVSGGLGATEQTEELPARACKTLDLLLDVEMPIAVSFGRAQVRIQEVLKLITGSIIELDRSISEPVDVLVNNRVIARGVVVVVDGNYGVKINEVMSREERLQQSRKYMLPIHTHHR